MPTIACDLIENRTKGEQCESIAQYIAPPYPCVIGALLISTKIKRFRTAMVH
jgi:hypothetical protein